MWKEYEMREFQDPYCYKGTNVLINNLGIRNEKIYLPMRGLMLRLNYWL